jgi:endonuclease-3
MNKNTSKEIVSLLKEVIPNPKCELDYNNMFELLVAVMLSAQTTDKRVNIVTKELFSKYPTAYDLMNANYDDVYNIICPVGLAKNKTKNLLELSKSLYENYNSIVPNTIEELTMLPGVGRKTANVILAEGFKIPAFPVDTHVHRIGHRLGYYQKDVSVLEAERVLTKYIPEEEWIDGHHLFLLFGRYHCKAVNPKCSNCKLEKYCKIKK